MIDTIKFLIPMPDINLVEQLKGNLMRFRKDDLKTGKVEFEFLRMEGVCKRTWSCGNPWCDDENSGG